MENTLATFLKAYCKSGEQTDVALYNIKNGIYSDFGFSARIETGKETDRGIRLSDNQA